MRAAEAVIRKHYRKLASGAYSNLFGRFLRRQASKHGTTLHLMLTEPTKYDITAGGISHCLSPVRAALYDPLSTTRQTIGNLSFLSVLPNRGFRVPVVQTNFLPRHALPAMFGDLGCRGLLGLAGAR